MKLVNNDKLTRVVESIDKPKEVVGTMPATQVNAIEQSEEFKKHFAEVIDEKKKEAEAIVVPSPDTGKKAKETIYTKLTLDESLFEACEDVCPECGKNPCECDKDLEECNLKEDLLPDATTQKPGFDDWDESYAEKFLGMKIASMDKEDGNDLTTVILKDLEFDPDHMTGKPGPHGGYHATPSDDEMESHAIGVFDDGVSVMGRDAEQLDNAKRIANKYADFGVFYEMKDWKGRGTGYFNKILYIYIPEFDDAERTDESFNKSDDNKDSVCPDCGKNPCECDRVLKENKDYTIEVDNKILTDEDGNTISFNSVEDAQDYIEDNEIENAQVTKQFGKSGSGLNEAKVDINLNNYESNEQGQVTLDKIKEEGKLEAFDALLSEMYPDGINEQTLDDLLIFESDWIFQMLGIVVED